MRKSSLQVCLLCSLSAAIFSCGGTNTITNPDNGGSDVGGGPSATGGSATGGASSNGGTSAQAAGGVVNTGGSSSVAMPTGGKSATGGSPGAGGALATGGSVAGLGGSQAKTGGAPATGGSVTGAGGQATGGKSNATGGSPVGTGGSGPGATGGKSGTGGTASATGGSTPGGGAASFKCDNLALAPNTTGAKPTGTAGGMKVLDWAGFKGAVSFTFDDNTPSQIPNYAAMKATGARFTWFVVGSWSPSSQYKATIADGQEVANHTYSHKSVSGYSDSTAAQNDLKQNETYLTTNFGVTAASMAAPNCDSAWANLAPNLLFQNRGPCSGSAATISPRDNTSPFALPAYLPATGADASTLQGTYVAGKWRIFVIHGFDSQNGTYQPVPIASVTGAMTNAVTNGYWTEGMTNVGAYWQGQKLISASATTSATWTLPAHFPPNMCVRITTTGGTVKQKGQEVPWDSHGYYQISLDAGSVTIE
jgi:hypothetical protein